MRILGKYFVFLWLAVGMGFVLSAQEEFVRWLDDGQALLKVASDQGHQYTSVDVIKGKEKKLKEAPVTATDKKDEGSGHDVVVRNADIYLIKTDGSEIRLTHDEGVEKNPRLSASGQRVAYTKNHDLYVYDLARKNEIRLTHDGSESIYNGWASWVYYEEILGRSSRYAAFWWSPDNDHIAFLRFDDRPVPQFTLFRSEGQRGALEINHYPKAGDPNPDVKFGVVNVETKKISWVEEDAEKDQYSALPYWTPDGKYLLIQEVNRGQDTLKIVRVDPQTGSRQEIYHEQQPTWVEFYEEMHFFKNGDFMLRSNKDGWYNLYRYDLEGNLVNQITDVNWRITEVVSINEDAGRIYFYGTGDDPADQQFFVVEINDGKLRQLTKEDGWHDVELSPDHSAFYDRYSALDNPGGMYLAAVDSDQRRDLDGQLSNANQAAGVKVEYFRVHTSDDFDLPAFWVLPKNFNPNEKYPVVFSIYGGPDAGSIRNRYRNYAGNFFSNNGIIQFVIDHRASGKFGKRGLDYMHRSLGKWEMHDYIEGVKFLRGKSFVDQSKMGIMGGSYGGYVTALALTYGSDYFTHGVSLFPVTDWQLYDNVYTERYMDTPAENPEGYKFGSALTHADQLKGELLIVHGMMDDNVHMQNTMQLVSELQDLNKDFEMMVYPGERHGWGGPKRRHLTRLTNGFWMKHFVEPSGHHIMKP